MATPQHRRDQLRRRIGDPQARVPTNSIARMTMFGMGRMRVPQTLPLDAPMPEPDEELADSELDEAERRAAIARERARREGLI